MQHSAHYRFVDVDIAIPDFQVVATIRVRAHPSLIVDVRPLAAEIRQRNQVSDFTSLALRET